MVGCSCFGFVGPFSAPNQQPAPAITFEHELDNRLHSNLVIRARSRRTPLHPKNTLLAPVGNVPHHIASEAISTASAISALTSASTPSYVDSAYQVPCVTTPLSSAPLSKLAKQVEKKRILDDYQSQFGAPGEDATPIVSCKIG